MQAGKITFILRGVTLKDDVEEKKMPKFVTRAKSSRRGNGKIQTKTVYSGQRIRIAYVGSTKFSSDVQTTTCFWCHHPYDTPLICAPLSYKKDGEIYRFQGLGSYCSLFCLRAHLQDLENYKPSRQPHWLQTAKQLTILAFSLMYPPEVSLKPAPHWKELETYNGIMTINEFRKANCDKTYFLTPNVKFESGESVYISQ